MKLYFLSLFLIVFHTFSQDTLLLVRQATLENDTLTQLKTIEYNSKNLPVYSISVNYKSNDTTEIFTQYNSENKIRQYLQNGPYFRDRWDTTFYTYENNNSITTQKGRNSERIRKVDSLDRHLSSSTKSFNDTGRLIIHKVDSTFYDDINYISKSKSYRKMDIPKASFSNSKETHRMNIDGDVIEVEFPPKIDIRAITNSNFSDRRFELIGENTIVKNKEGQALEIWKGNSRTGKYEYDSLDRIVYLEVKNSHKDDTTFMKYTYETIGDTLIKTDWRLQSREDKMPVKGSVYKESIAKIDGNTLWTYVFVDGLLIAESNRVYNDENQLTKILLRRKKEGEWSEIKYVYEYEKF